MPGTGEFLAQVLPLFLQIIGLPVAVGIGYYAYKNYYVPRKNQPEAKTESTTEQTHNPLPPIETISTVDPDPVTYNEIDNLPPIDFFNESDLSSQTEENPMSNQQPEQKPSTQSKKIDTSELPPLDMLLGALDEEPEPEPVPIINEPPQVVQLRKMSKGVQHVQLNSGQIAPAQEIITILRDEDDGKLIIQVGDTAYRTLADNAEVKRLFTKVMKELAGTITQPDSTPPARKRYVVGQPEQPKAQPKPTPKSEPTPQPDTSISSLRDLLVDEAETDNTPTPAVKPKSTTPPPPLADGAMPGDLPSYRLDDNPLKTEKTGRFSSKTEAEPVPELDLAAAIETYLQYKLQHTPEYAGRNIHIHGTPSGTIRIQVDSDYYDFVDEVADANVRAFLQSTIAEWQDRQ